MVELWIFPSPPSLWDEEKRCQGQDPDAPGLSLRGWLQAKRIAEYLGRFELGSIYTSKARRAVDLAGLVQQHQKTSVSLFFEDALGEMQLGIIEGLTEEETKKTSPKSWAQWLEKTFEPDLPCFIGGETPEQVALRIEDVLSRIARENIYSHKPVIIVSHRFALSFALAKILYVPLPKAALLTNGGLSRVSWKYGLQVVEINSLAHLEDTTDSSKVIV